MFTKVGKPGKYFIEEGGEAPLFYSSPLALKERGTRE
jgi:hypothetical protein